MGHLLGVAFWRYFCHYSLQFGRLQKVKVVLQAPPKHNFERPKWSKRHPQMSQDSCVMSLEAIWDDKGSELLFKDPESATLGVLNGPKTSTVVTRFLYHVSGGPKDIHRDSCIMYLEAIRHLCRQFHCIARRSRLKHRYYCNRLTHESLGTGSCLAK